MSIRGRGRLWSVGEKFEILKYAIEGAEELSEKLGRSISSIKTMAQNLNATKTYNKGITAEECTTIMFCNDCVNSPKECGKKVQECISEEDAKLYTKFHKVKDLAESSPDKVTIVWTKRKRSNRINQETLPFNM